MAGASVVPPITRGLNPNRFIDVRSPGIISNRNEIVEETMSYLIEEKIYVPVGRDVEKYKSVLFWALQHSGGKKIFVIHVHQKAKMIPVAERFTWWQQHNCYDRLDGESQTAGLTHSGNEIWRLSNIILKSGVLRHSLQDRLSKSTLGKNRDEIYLKLKTSTS